MNVRKKVLWLVSWYPNKYDLFDGDFIQRHAKAAALYNDIYVLFIKQFSQQNDIEIERREEQGLVEKIIYLPKAGGFIGKMKNFFLWRGLYKKEIDLFVKENHPHLLHIHIPWKVGLIALWAKRKYNLPVVVTEHWGIYNDVVDDNIHNRSQLFRMLTKRIYNAAVSFISVSQFLGEGVNRTVTKKPFIVIPNVVDSALFFPSQKKYERFTFLHVSNMVPLKNVEGIIDAFYQFQLHNKTNAQLVLVGSRNEKYVTRSIELGLLNTSVFFRGEVAYEEVAKEMQCSHVFILNSFIENSPCVIGEALCCGLPVIATKVGGIPELVDESNSILITPKDTAALAMAMNKIYYGYKAFEPSSISFQGQKRFSFPVVGQAFSKAYEEITIG